MENVDEKLRKAVRESDAAAVKEAVLGGADPNGTESYWPLRTAAENGLSDIAKTLLECGADPDKPTPEYSARCGALRPPLASAVYYGDAKLVGHLLDAGAKVAVEYASMERQPFEDSICRHYSDCSAMFVEKRTKEIVGGEADLKKILDRAIESGNYGFADWMVSKFAGERSETVVEYAKRIAGATNEREAPCSTALAEAAELMSVSGKCVPGESKLRISM